MTITIALLAGGKGVAQAPSAGGQEKALTEIPDRFFQVQDSFGFFWQAAGNGSLTSGETQYLQSGLNLVVDGEVFEPKSGSELAPGEGVSAVELLLEEEREPLALSRQLWFDKERGGVRVRDTVTNRSGENQVVQVKLRTTYPFAWKSLHASDGGQLSSDPSLRLAPGDGSLVIRFGPSEGRPDTLILASDGNDENHPALEASANRRELSLVYELALKPGESQSLLHWVLRRLLPEPSEAASALAGFWQRGSLVRPGIEAALFDRFSNFDASAFAPEAVAPTRLRSLIALNELIDRVGIHRRSEEILWISTANQMAGAIDPAVVLKFDAAHLGELDVPLSKVAAITGGGGFGRTHLLYLRDGTVLSGRALGGPLEMSLGEDGGQEIDLSGLNLLLFRTEKSDGTAPDGAELFVELRDGTVMALASSESLVLSGVSAWGELEVPFSEIAEAGYLSQPSPRMVVKTKAGDRLSLFLLPGSLSLSVASGSEVEVGLMNLRRLWGMDASGLEIAGENVDWVDLEEVPGDTPDTALLLRGNTVVSGRISDASLSIDTDGSRIRLQTDQIVRMRRMYEEGNEESASFVVSLKNGDEVTGRISQEFIDLDSPLVSRVPFVDVLEYRKIDSP